MENETSDPKFTLWGTVDGCLVPLGPVAQVGWIDSRGDLWPDTFTPPPGSALRAVFAAKDGTP